MTPSIAITKADEQIGRNLIALVSHLRDEAADIAEQWHAIGRAGGQRDDHAAALLGRLAPHLREIERFAACCQRQIDAMRADPFGRKEGAA